MASAYYQLALIRRSLPLAEQAVALAEKQQLLAERRVTSGDATQRDLLEMSLELAQAQRSLRDNQRMELEAAQAFSLATGLDGALELVLPEPVAVPADLAQVMSTLEGRSDIRAAENMAEAARLTRLAQDLDWLPTFRGNFTYNYNQNSGFLDEEVFWVAGVTGNWTLWDGGNRIALQRREASQQRSARIQVEQTRQQAEQELKNAWESLRQSQLALEVAEGQLSLAEQNLQLAEASEGAGSITSLDGDSARLLHLQAEIGVVREQINRDLAAVRLRMAMGDF